MANMRKSRARTAEQKEGVLLSLASNLAEEKLRDGTASSQLICQILSMGSEKKKLENEKLRSEVELSRARIRQIEENNKTSEFYDRVIKAFKQYSGDSCDDEYYSDEDEYYD